MSSKMDSSVTVNVNRAETHEELMPVAVASHIVAVTAEFSDKASSISK